MDYKHYLVSDVNHCYLAVRAAQQHQKRQRHHFWGIAEVEGPVPSTRQRRLVRELRSLARELPLYWGSTIAVRVDDDRPHLLKVKNVTRRRRLLASFLSNYRIIRVCYGTLRIRREIGMFHCSSCTRPKWK